MALTTGTIAASGTPATDFHAQITTVLNAAGWVHVGQKTAAVMGTTGVVEVWATADTPSAFDVWGSTGPEGGGCILYLEIDNTNERIRVRASEGFDDALVNEPSSNVFTPCPGDAAGASLAPTSSYRRTDSGQVLFQTPPNTNASQATVGWVEIAASSGGFDFWLGADATRFLAGGNSSGQSNWGTVGRLDFLGPAGGNTAVILAGGNRGTTVNLPLSWNMLGTNARVGNLKCSREPLTTTSIQTPFHFSIGPTYPGISGISEDLTGGLTVSHRWHTTFVASPCFIHGANLDTWGSIARSHLGRLTDFVYFITGATEPTIGDTVTIGATTYVLLGRNDGELSTLTGDHMARSGIAVRESAF